MQNTFLDWEFQGRRIPLALPPIAKTSSAILEKEGLGDSGSNISVDAVLAKETSSFCQKACIKSAIRDGLGGAKGRSCLRSESMRWFSLGSKTMLEE